MEKILSVIYKITNIENSKKYIGSSVNYKNRKQEHFRDLLLNKHHSAALQRAYNKYGKDNFLFEIIEYVPNKNELISREQYYIDTLKPEYNCCKIAGSILGRKMTEKQLIWNSEKSKGEKNPNSKIKNEDVLQIFELRKTKTVKEISKIYNVNISTISRILNNKTFTELNKSDKSFTKIYSQKSKEKLSKIAKENSNGSIPVIDLNTGVFYDSIADLSRILKINTSTLRDRIALKYNPLPNYKII